VSIKARKTDINHVYVHVIDTSWLILGLIFLGYFELVNCESIYQSIRTSDQSLDCVLSL